MYSFAYKFQIFKKFRGNSLWTPKLERVEGTPFPDLLKRLRASLGDFGPMVWPPPKSKFGLMPLLYCQHKIVRNTNVYNEMRYINLRFTYLLTYLLMWRIFCTE